MAKKQLERVYLERQPHRLAISRLNRVYQMLLDHQQRMVAAQANVEAKTQGSEVKE